MPIQVREDARPGRDEAGFSIIEVLIALTFMTAGALTLLSVMATTAENDELNRERAVATRAVLAQMEEVLAFDDDGDIDNFISQWGDPANQGFTVADLRSPDVSGAPAPGTVTIDATDSSRVAITITLRWTSRLGRTRQRSLPFTKTETLR